MALPQGVGRRQRRLKTGRSNWFQSTAPAATFAAISRRDAATAGAGAGTGTGNVGHMSVRDLRSLVATAPPKGRFMTVRLTTPSNHQNVNLADNTAKLQTARLPPAEQLELAHVHRARQRHSPRIAQPPSRLNKPWRMGKAAKGHKLSAKVRARTQDDIRKAAEARRDHIARTRGGVLTTPSTLIEGMRQQLRNRKYKYFHKTIKSFDKDGDGILSPEELYEGLRVFYPGTTNEQGAEVLQAIQEYRKQFQDKFPKSQLSEEAQAALREKEDTQGHVSVQSLFQFLLNKHVDGDPFDPYSVGYDSDEDMHDTARKLPIYHRSKADRRRDVHPITLRHTVEGALEILLTKVESSTVRKVFQSLDADKNGVITCKEFRNALIRMRVGLVKKHFDALIDILDKNGDGVVDHNEFVGLVTNAEGTFNSAADKSKKGIQIAATPPSARKSKPDYAQLDTARVDVVLNSIAQHAQEAVDALPASHNRIRKLFQVMDRKQTGFVPVADVENVLHRRYGQHGYNRAGLSKAQAHKLATLCDTNSDGYVQIGDLRAVLQRLHVAGEAQAGETPQPVPRDEKRINVAAVWNTSARGDSDSDSDSDGAAADGTASWTSDSSSSSSWDGSAADYDDGYSEMGALEKVPALKLNAAIAKRDNVKALVSPRAVTREQRIAEKDRQVGRSSLLLSARSPRTDVFCPVPPSGAAAASGAKPLTARAHRAISVAKHQALGPAPRQSLRMPTPASRVQRVTRRDPRSPRFAVDTNRVIKPAAGSALGMADADPDRYVSQSARQTSAAAATYAAHKPILDARMKQRIYGGLII